MAGKIPALMTQRRSRGRACKIVGGWSSLGYVAGPRTGRGRAKGGAVGEAWRWSCRSPAWRRKPAPHDFACSHRPPTPTPYTAPTPERPRTPMLWRGRRRMSRAGWPGQAPSLPCRRLQPGCRRPNNSVSAPKPPPLHPPHTCPYTREAEDAVARPEEDVVCWMARADALSSVPLPPERMAVALRVERGDGIMDGAVEVSGPAKIWWAGWCRFRSRQRGSMAFSSGAHVVPTPAGPCGTRAAGALWSTPW